MNISGLNFNPAVFNKSDIGCPQTPPFATRMTFTPNPAHDKQRAVCVGDGPLVRSLQPQDLENNKQLLESMALKPLLPPISLSFVFKLSSC